jgi:DNA polymerase-3 subunit gamma/tau
MRSLMDFAHRVAVTQIGKSGADAPSAEEREEIEGWAERLSPGQLHRLWQLLLKGHDEVRNAPDPLVATQMALLRVMHAADMPDPGTLAKMLEEMAAKGIAAAPAPGGNGAAGEASRAAAPDWKALVEQVKQSRIDGTLALASKMELQVRVVALEPGRLTYSLAQGFKEDLSPELRDGLLKVTGERWQVELVDGEGAPTLIETAEALKAEECARIRGAPIVEAAFAAFPDAELVEEEKAAAGGDLHWNRRA